MIDDIKQYFKSSEGKRRLALELGALLYKKGAEPADLLRRIMHAYDDESEHEEACNDRLALNVAAGAIMECCGSPFASEYWKELGLRRKPRHTHAETAYMEVFGVGLMFDYEYSDSVSTCRRVQSLHPAYAGKVFSNEELLTLAPESKLCNILLADEEDRIIAYRDRDGALNLGVLNFCQQDMLVDESPYNGEPPCYFTESTHFRSPVDILKCFTRIFRWLLDILDFPPIRIGQHVFFFGQKINLFDWEFFRHNGKYSAVWEGITLKERSKLHGRPFINKPYPLWESDKDNEWSEYDRMIVFSLRAASLIWERLRPGCHHLNLTAEDIKKAANDLKIFTTLCS